MLRLACTELCLVALGGEIHGEIGFALFSVGVNCLRDLRVVVDIIFGLITCAGFSSWPKSQTWKDQAESRSLGMKMSIRIAELSSLE